MPEVTLPPILREQPTPIINPKNTESTMKKKETWKTILQIIASIVSAALTALGTTSCMGYGPVAF